MVDLLSYDRRKRERRTNKVLSRIELSALASAMLAILFVLMVSVIIQPDLPTHGVDLPHSDHALPIPQARRDDAIMIEVQRDGRIFFGNREIAMGEISNMVHESLVAGAQRKVYLRADARARYLDVEGVLKQIGDAGITDVDFLTVPTPNMSPH